MVGWRDDLFKLSGYPFPAELSSTATGSEGQVAWGEATVLVPISIGCMNHHDKLVDSYNSFAMARRRAVVVTQRWSRV